MHELGNVQSAARGMHALNPARNEMPDPTHETAKITIADDDAAAAVIRYPSYTENIQKDNKESNTLFSASRPTKTDSRTGAKPAACEQSRYVVYSDPSGLRLKIADEIHAINSFDGFLIGVHRKIEKFEKKSEFSLEQILDAEKRRTELYETLELYRFTLRRIRAEARKALRCQGNLGPERVLRLLKESATKQNTTRQTTGEQIKTDLK